MRHTQKDAKNVDGQQRKYDYLDRFDHNILKFVAQFFQMRRRKEGNAQAQRKRGYERSHHIQDWRNVNRKIRPRRLNLRKGGHRIVSRNQVGKQRSTRKIRNQSGPDRIKISNQGRNSQEFSGSLSYISDGGRYEAQNNQGYEKLEKVAEDTVKSGKDANCRNGQEIAKENT